jgi:hypothetical protein
MSFYEVTSKKLRHLSFFSRLVGTRLMGDKPGQLVSNIDQNLPDVHQKTTRIAMTIIVNPSCIIVASSIICVPNLGEKIPV